MTPAGLPARTATRAGAPPPVSSGKASSSVAVTSTTGSARSMTSPTVRSTTDGSRNARSSSPFSEMEPTMASRASPSGASETGIWLMPYCWRRSMASPTRWGVRARTRAGRGEDAFVGGEAGGEGEGVAIRNAHPAVYGRRIERAGDEVLADPLLQVWPRRVPGEDAALRVGADDAQVRVLRAQVMDRPADRAAGADAGHEVGDAALGLAPDLRSGGQLVRPRVLHVPVLVGLVGAGDVAGQAGRHGVVALRRLGRDVGGAEHDLRAVRPQQRLLLGRLLVGHDEDAAIALQGRGDGQAVAGVAAGWLDDRAARLQETRPLGGLDHGQPDAILDGAAGVDHLELGQDERLTVPWPEIAGDAREPDERRVPDQLEDRLGAVHRGRVYRL